MKASEARELTESHINNEEVPKIMEFVYGKIKDAASAGANCINNPFDDFPRRMFLSQGLKKRVYSALESQGYTVTNHENPDPGDPRSSAYTSIEW